MLGTCVLWRVLFGLVWFWDCVGRKRFILWKLEIIECGGVFVFIFVVYSLVFGIDFYPSIRE